MVNQIRQSRALIRKRNGRQFTGSLLITLVSIAELMLIQFYNPSMLNLSLIGILPILYILATFTPRYRVYQWALNGESIRTDFSYMIEVIRSKLNVFGTILILFFSLLPFVYLFNPDYFVSNSVPFRVLNFYFYLVNCVFPIFIVFNFYRNYIRKPN